MKLVRALLFGQVILLLGNTINGKPKKVYHLKLVKNIAEPLDHDKSNFDWDETNADAIVDTDGFSEDERMEMCELSANIVNDRTEDRTFEFVKNVKTSPMKQYALDIHSNSQPKITLAFKCPIKPPIFIQVQRLRSNEQLVNVIVRYSDIVSMILCADDMCYEVKLVEEILPVPGKDVQKYKEEMRNAFDTNELSEELRLQMCKKSLTVDVLQNRNFKFFENGNTDVRRLYVMTLEKKRPDFPPEIVLAFRCPTIPAVYLDVRKIDDDDQVTYWVAAITNKIELPPRFNEIIFRYQLREALSISKCSAPTESGAWSREKFFNLLRPFIFPSSLTAIDPTRFTDLQRFRMCREAFQELHQEEGRYLELLEDTEPGKCEYYRVYFKPGKPKELQAFKCPIKPSIYLSVADQTPNGQNVWVILVETDSLNIVGYQMKIVVNITEVPVNKLLKSTELQSSTVDPDDLGPERRRRLCEKALQIVSGMKIKSATTSKPEMSRYYSLETSESESENTENRIVQAYKCTSDPEIYLHVATREDGGNILWIIMRETETLPAIDFVGYQVKVVDEIREVLPPELMQVPVGNMEESAINTNRLPEAKRQQMCRIAMETASLSGIEFFENIKTGTQKYYALDVESQKGHRESRIFVQAFECPTEPPIYIHVNDEEDGLVVWIIVKESKPTIAIEDLSYDLKIVQKIEEISFAELLREPSGSIGKSVINTDKLSEEQRLLICRKAMETVPQLNLELLDNTATEEQKYYALDIDPETESTSSPLLRIFAQAFKCPTEPSMFLHIDDVEEGDGHIVWIIVEERKPFPQIDLTSCHFKLVKNISLVPLKELTPTIRGRIEERGVLNTDRLSENYRVQLCEKAMQLTSEERIGIVRKDKSGRSLYYYITELERRSNKRPEKVIRAFRCPTEPLIYLQVTEVTAEKYSITVFIKESDLIDECDETCYIVNFVDIIESSSSETRAQDVSAGYNPDELDESDLLEMCEEAIEQPALAGRNIALLRDGEIKSSNFYSLYEFSQSEDRNARPDVVKAFPCPSAPPIYLHIHSWGFHKNIVWIIVKKRESRSPRRRSSSPSVRRQGKKLHEKSDTEEPRGARKPSQSPRAFSDSGRTTVFRRANESGKPSETRQFGAVASPSTKWDETSDEEEIEKIRDGTRQARRAFSESETRTRFEYTRGSTGPRRAKESAQRRETEQFSAAASASKTWNEISDVEETQDLRPRQPRPVIRESGSPTRFEGLRRSTGSKKEKESEDPREMRQFRRTGSTSKMWDETSDLEEFEHTRETAQPQRASSESESPSGLRRSGSRKATEAEQPREGRRFRGADLTSKTWKETSNVGELEKRESTQPQRASSESGSPSGLRRSGSRKVTESEQPREGRRFKGTGISSRTWSETSNVEELEKRETRQPQRASSESESPSRFESVRSPTDLRKVRESEQPREERLFRESASSSKKQIETSQVGEVEQTRAVRRESESRSESKEVKGSTVLIQSEESGQTGVPRQFRVVARASKKWSETSIVVEREETVEPKQPRRMLSESGRQVEFLQTDSPEISEETKEVEESRESEQSDEVIGITYSHVPDTVKLKYIDDIHRAPERTVRLMPSSRKERSMLDTDKHYTESQRLEMCRTAMKLVPDAENVSLLKGRKTGRSLFYIVQESLEENKTSEHIHKIVRAFDCPTVPKLYLQVRFLKEKGIIMTIFIKDEDYGDEPSIWFEVKHVDTISETSETSPDTKQKSSINTGNFKEDRRLWMCSEGIKLFPQRKIDFKQHNEHSMVDKSYLLNAESEPVVVKAFKCPTIPALYIQVTVNEFHEYTAYVIIPKSKPKPQRAPTSGHFDDMFYELLLVDNIVDLETHGETSYEEFPPILPIKLTREEREKVCENGMKLIPGHELIEPTYRKLKDDQLYVINFLFESQPRERLISAYECPTSPSVYIELYIHKNTKKVAAKVIIKRMELPC